MYVKTSEVSTATRLIRQKFKTKAIYDKSVDERLTLNHRQQNCRKKNK